MYADQDFSTADSYNAPRTEFLPSGVMRHEFMAFLPEGVLAQKVSAFVTEEEAHVLGVSEDEVHLQIGRRRWLRWNPQGEDFPLEVTLRINRQTACSRELTHVIADVRPLVARVPQETLRWRFVRIVRGLRSCFLAQELELAS